MSRCPCCGAAEGCMFEAKSQPSQLRSLRARNNEPAPSAEQSHVRVRDKKVNPDNEPLRESQLLLKFREGGPGFTRGFHEEKRAWGLTERGWLSATKAVFRNRHDRFGNDIVEYRNRYTITEEGKKALKDYEKRGSRA